MIRFAAITSTLLIAAPAFAQGWGNVDKKEEETGFSWTAPLWPSFWMAWTPATFAFFCLIFSAILVIGILEVTKFKDGIERRGDSWSAEEEAAFKQPTLDMFEEQSHPLYASARLWDDGVIDPRKSREVLALRQGDFAFNDPLDLDTRDLLTADEAQFIAMLHHMRRDETGKARDAVDALTRGQMDPDLIRAGLSFADRFPSGARHRLRGTPDLRVVQ